MKITKVEGLANIANDIRIEIIEQIYNASSGHPGGSLSCADILAVLYFNQMNINPKDPNAEGRDRLVLSKGHSSPALYATLARKGYFDKSLLTDFRRVKNFLRWPFIWFARQRLSFCLQQISIQNHWQCSICTAPQRSFPFPTQSFRPRSPSSR